MLILGLTLLASTAVVAILLPRIGSNLIPDTNPFLVFSILSKYKVVFPFINFITTSSLPRLNPFFKALLILNRFTHSSGTNFTSLSTTTNFSPFFGWTMHLKLPTFFASILLPLPTVISSKIVV